MEIQGKADEEKIKDYLWPVGSNTGAGGCFSQCVRKHGQCHRFEKQTGLMLGKNGGSHVQKGIDMAKYIENKILIQSLNPSDRELATRLLEDLYNALGR